MIICVIKSFFLIPRLGCEILKTTNEILQIEPHNGAKFERVDVDGLHLRGGGYVGSVRLPRGGCMQPSGGLDRRDVRHPPS